MTTIQTMVMLAGAWVVIWAGMWASRINKRRRAPRFNGRAGWECFACGHVERCTNRDTFWKDVGATLHRHGFENHPGGHDYALHVPKGWERKKRRGKPHPGVDVNQPGPVYPHDANLRKDTP